LSAIMPFALFIIAAIIFDLLAAISRHCHFDTPYCFSSADYAERHTFFTPLIVSSIFRRRRFSCFSDISH